GRGGVGGEGGGGEVGEGGGRGGAGGGGEGGWGRGFHTAHYLLSNEYPWHLGVLSRQRGSVPARRRVDCRCTGGALHPEETRCAISGARGQILPARRPRTAHGGRLYRLL